MSWMATERFEARSAPAGLALVQDLVNTHAVERDGHDLLIDLATAQEWLLAAGRRWAAERGLASAELALDESDLPPMRDLRDMVQAMLANPTDHTVDDGDGEPSRESFVAIDVTRRAQVDLVSDADGRVALVPTGTGRGWLESAVWSEILLAQRTGSWTKLKLCREPGCLSAFYDASRNGSGVWHNVRTCGNIANLRASRTRKKARTTMDER